MAVFDRRCGSGGLTGARILVEQGERPILMDKSISGRLSERSLI